MPLPLASSAACRLLTHGAVLVLAGCAAAAEPHATEAVVLADGGPPPALTAGDAGSLGCPERVPRSDFGTSVGRHLSDVTLRTCDGSDHSFYGPSFCDAELTVVALVTGWCAPAVQLSAALETELTEPYGPAVRVLEVLLQTETHGVPDPTYCQEWAARFGRSNGSLIDPEQRTAVHSPSGTYPTVLIVDREGVIRFRMSTFSDGFAPVVAALEALLAE